MIYVDELRGYVGKRKKYCHMMTDGSINELHKFAQKIGLSRSWFQFHPYHPHYDLTEYKRTLAVRSGAVQVGGVELVRLCSRNSVLADSGNLLRLIKEG